MERTYTLHDALAVLRRRRALALIVGGIALAVGLVSALAVPSEYAATSVVEIEPRRLPADFFPAQNAAGFEDRMRTVKHGILARPVLERAVKETDLYPDLRGDVDAAVERLRRNVEVRLEGEVAGGPPALLFVVEVRGTDPARLAKVAELLPRYYADLTRDVLVVQARALRATLDRQVADLGAQLSRDEARVLAFKIEHVSELPETVETNARSLARVQGLIAMRLGTMTDARRRRSELLATVPEGPTAPGLSEAGLDAALRKLQAAEAAYGPDHPDVKRARRELEEAQAHRDEQVSQFRAARLQPHVARIDAEIREDEAAIAQLEQERLALQRRVEAAPRWGQELANMARDYDVLKGRYASAVAKRSDAAASEALLAADQATMFNTIEAPARPTRPVAPDRPRLLWLAALAALAAGLGAVGIAEWLDASVRGPEDAASMGVPVLAAIPRIGPAGRA